LRNDPEFIDIIKKAYVEGLVWIYSYYYKGCISYEWYYEFHYSPFASDLKDLSKLKIEFILGKNFSPVEQLLSVLPKFSNKALPPCVQSIMEDENSDLVDFFPTKTQLDMNGNYFSWMGVNLVPFIEAKRIRKAVKLVANQFTTEENERFKEGTVHVFLNSKESLLLNHISENETTFVHISNFVGFYKCIIYLT
jgi:5'-3' exoribonuclease 2